jgi:hypothetical protein
MLAYATKFNQSLCWTQRGSDTSIFSGTGCPLDSLNSPQDLPPRNCWGAGTPTNCTAILPTLRPTKTPTTAPTKTPTKKPTKKPTKHPNCGHTAALASEQQNPIYYLVRAVIRLPLTNGGAWLEAKSRTSYIRLDLGLTRRRGFTSRCGQPRLALA